jgi:hypothetical protein
MHEEFEVTWPLGASHLTNHYDLVRQSPLTERYTHLHTNATKLPATWPSSFNSSQWKGLMKDSKGSHPLWETVVMVGSFVLLWVWFLARQAALRNGGVMWPGWTVLQIVALVALVVVTVRRVARVRRALRGEDGHNVMPWRFPPPNGHTRK